MKNSGLLNTLVPRNALTQRQTPLATMLRGKLGKEIEMRMGRVLRNDTFTAEDVRTELYRFLNDLREQQNHHSIAWSKHSDGHPDNCYVCRDYGIRREAVKAAIKRFGGSPGKRW